MTLRQRSRELYPNWSRKQRAKWVLARMHVDRIKEPRVNVSALTWDDARHYSFARSAYE